MEKINVPCLVVGQSGSGKSSSARNLPADKTVIINCERKPMPFKGFAKFKNINVGKHKEFMQVMKELKASDKYDYVVIDSLTSLLEMMNKYCSTVYSGYNIYSEYNDLVYNVLQDIKDLPQQVFITAIPEYLDAGDGVQKAYAKTKGKEYKYSIEKEFAIVLHTHLIDDDEGNIIEYLFDTKPSKYTSAKSPDGMFEERYIPNDLALVDKKIQEYYGGD
jgi:adenosyl cobinamide kinase/adenosyl cobinamide phosphate guanylyltransferase